MKRTVPFLLLALATGAALAAAAQNAPARPMKIKVTAEQANLREKPDIGSSIVQQIPEGTVLEADKKEGEWYFVRYALEDGGVIGGWIHESLVEVVEMGGPAVETVKKPAAETPPPPRERVSRPIRIGRIKAPEFRTGSIPLEFSFSVGVATLAPRDLNDGTLGFADWTGASLGLTGPKHVGILHLTALAGFELSYRLSPRLALGLGADIFQGRNGSQIVLADDLVSETVTTRPSARGVPLKVVARYYPGAGIYVRGALGLYSAKASYTFRREGADSWEQWKGSATASRLGGEAAFGGEWTIAPRTLLFAEAGLRMASFSGLTGQNIYTNSAGADLVEPGTLYFFHRPVAGAGDFPLILVMGSAPSEPDFEARQAKINLSGTAVRVGVRYQF